MPVQQRRYTAEETARRGDELYAKLRDELEPCHLGRVVAIDIESGECAVDDTVLAACKRLKATRPQAEIWAVRIGHPAIHRIGRSRPEPA